MQLKSSSNVMMSDKKLLFNKNKKKGNYKKNRFLISVSVLGSTGPLRFVVNEDDLVSGVIDVALKSYARDGRLPLLGFDFNNFLLYGANDAPRVLNANEAIGSCEGCRNFVLCKKQLHPQMTEARSDLLTKNRSSPGWRKWLHKSFKF